MQGFGLVRVFNASELHKRLIGENLGDDDIAALKESRRKKLSYRLLQVFQKFKSYGLNNDFILLLCLPSCDYTNIKGVGLSSILKLMMDQPSPRDVNRISLHGLIGNVGGDLDD